MNQRSNNERKGQWEKFSDEEPNNAKPPIAGGTLPDNASASVEQQQLDEKRNNQQSVGTNNSDSQENQGRKNTISEVLATLNGKKPYSDIDLSWDKPINNPVSYEVTVYEKSTKKVYGTPIPVAGENETTIGNLLPETEYYFTVIAKYSNGSPDAPVQSNAINTFSLPAKLLKVQKIEAYLDTKIPARQINVNWNKLKVKFEKSHYEVFLLCNGNPITERKHVPEKQMKTYFYNLKSNTTYIACVVTVGKKQNKSEETYSEPVTTARVIRDENFDIQAKGKAHIHTCRSKPEGGTLKSQLEWYLPDLGNEKYNFETTRVSALFEEKDKPGQKLEVSEYKKAKSTILKPGKTYTFYVEVTYTDLDNDKQTKAISSHKVTTDIGKPKIVDVICRNQEIIVSWIPAQGATRHTLKIGNGKNDFHEEALKENQTSIKIPIKEPYRYGETCTFKIQATTEASSTSEDFRTLLIGGDTAVREVTLTKNPSNPRRSLEVTWKSPAKTPEGYQIYLYKIKQPPTTPAKTSTAFGIPLPSLSSLTWIGKGRSFALPQSTVTTPSSTDIGYLFQEVKYVDQTQTSHIFIELETDTRYRCRVSPKYNKTTSNGTTSNEIKTDTRIKQTIESETHFGKPDKIVHAIKSEHEDDLTVELSWSAIHLGENYKLLHYKVVTKQINKWVNKTNVFDKEVSVKHDKVEMPNIKKGQKFVVGFTTFFLDLDSNEQRNEEKKYDFATDPRKIDSQKCSWNDGTVTFRWNPVSGAQKYQLSIRDEFVKKMLVPDKYSDECQVKIQMTDDLAIGKICTTKVIVQTESDTKSASEWKVHLIGGNLVPRNVLARRNDENPERCVDVSFDTPLKGPADHYEVIAKPAKGKPKRMMIKTNATTFEYLRKGIEYTFIVYAIHADKRSDGSQSNAISTDTGDVTKPMVNIEEATGGKYDFRQSNYSSRTSNVIIPKGEDFGKVRDVKVKITEENDKDIMKLTWIFPSFDNLIKDYKVEHYKIDVRKTHSEGRNYIVNFEKGLQQYTLSNCDLSLGETYTISITTAYEDIDQDVIVLSHPYQEIVHTRPAKPEIIHNGDQNERLKLEWNAVKGVQHYELEIFTENSERPKYTANPSETIWYKNFDENFGYGTTYFAVIKAVGKGNKKNSSKTTKETIGGDLVPRNVMASIKDVKDPNTQAFLNWDEPKQQPKSYEVLCDGNVVGPKFEINGTTCLVSNLKAGTYYLFKVIGIHSIDGQMRKSGGCISNKIQTNPKPRQVKNVTSKRGKEPSTSLEIMWEKVDAEKEDESTMYRVCLTACEIEHEININVTSEFCTVDGLKPATAYLVTVEGGNSIGYGRKSDEIRAVTALGTPKNVQLHLENTSTETSLKLTFSPAEGKATHYIANLFKHENQVEHEIISSCKVESGHIFSKLEHNSIYSVKLHAVFIQGEGDGVLSERILTDPPRAEITEYGCTIVDGERSSAELKVKWKSDNGCNTHEICINRGQSGIIENQLIVQNKNELIYTCQYEAIEYFVQVRSKNQQCFGKWSAEVNVQLAPSKLENVSAKLDKESKNIMVNCHTAMKDCPFYFAQAYCNEKIEGEPKEAHAHLDGKLVEFVFSPFEAAQKYTFLVWAENALKHEGKKSCTNSVISRPAKSTVPKVVQNEDCPSMDIHISWDPQIRCDAYEVWICCSDSKKPESIIWLKETFVKYRCQSPGSKYLVSICSICEAVRGEWSDSIEICLIPAEVELIEDGSQNPVKEVELKWKHLKVKPEHYVVILYEEGKKIEEVKTERCKYKFTNIKAGALFHCTVAAHWEGKTGKATKSKFYRIAWSEPTFFVITPDDNDPSRRAKMEWEHPYGVNCFKLQIENNQSGTVVELIRKDNRYVFQSGIPGNTYTVRLYCGCDSRYDLDCITKPMIMKPEPPHDIKVIPCQYINGFIVEYQDSSPLKKMYEIIAQPLNETLERKTVKTPHHRANVRNLIAGAAYSISVKSLIDDTESEVTTLEGYAKTIPGEIQNLRSKQDGNSILFEWDPLDIPPDKYKIQWRVGDENIIEEYTKNPKFEKRHLKPAEFYSLRLMAINSSGRGEMTDWETFITNPLPPRNYRVRPNEKNKTTSLIVTFDDDFHLLKKYRVEASCRSPLINDDRSEITDKHFHIFNDLKPGQIYDTKVQTIFCDEKMSQFIP